MFVVVVNHDNQGVEFTECLSYPADLAIISYSARIRLYLIFFAVARTVSELSSFNTVKS